MSAEDPVGVVSSVFRALEGAGVKWCWYKGYEDWPHAIGGDVDLAVHPSDLGKAVAAVSSAARERGARAFVPCSHADVTACFMMFEKRAAVEIDFFSNWWKWTGQRILHAEEVVASRRRHADVWIPAPEHECVLLLLLYGMVPRVAMERRVSGIERARELARRDPSACRQALVGALGRVGVGLWRLLECGEVEELIAAGRRVRLYALGRALAGRGAVGVVARAAWVYAGRALVARCGLWRGFGRSVQPVRVRQLGGVERNKRWLEQVVRRHEGAWLVKEG
jgi:hypothetical protein